MRTCSGSLTARDSGTPRDIGAPDGAFRFLLQRRRPGVNRLRGSIPGPHGPLPTPRHPPCERLRMTRGRCGSLLHIRMTFAFTTPRRFNRRTGDRLMKKNSTVAKNRNEIFKQPKLTIGLDLGDRWSFYCVLDEAGQVILEQKLPTTPEAMKQTFGKIPRSLIALETGTHSPWVSRLLSELGPEVIVAHSQRGDLFS